MSYLGKCEGMERDGCRGCHDQLYSTQERGSRIKHKQGCFPQNNLFNNRECF